jgi:thiol-disulfide isomerase/thioredoxin
MKSRWIVAAAAAGAIALLTVPMMLKSEGVDDRKAASAPGASCEGKANMDLTLKDMHNKPVRLADYKGQVVMLNFWATWCGPCQAEIPELIETYAAYKDRGFVILGVSIDDTPEDLQAYAAAKKMNYPVLQMQDDVDEAYGPIAGIPISYFIGRDGSICRRHFGPISKEQVEREIKGLL